MELTSKNVHIILIDCFFESKEDVTDPVMVEGVMRNLGLNRARLISHKKEILSMLKELPENFQKDIGGGWSFLNACVRKDGVQWGGQESVDELLCLGLGINAIEYCLPRDVWNVLPGGMPYFSITLESTPTKENSNVT